MEVNLDENETSTGRSNPNNQKKKNRKKNKEGKINEIEAISEKLENCVHLKQNGGLLVNGELGNGHISTLNNNHEENSQNEEKSSVNHCVNAKIAPTTSSGSKKKQKNRNKQKENTHDKIDDGRQSEEAINNNLDKIEDVNNSGSQNSLINNGCTSTTIISQPPTSTASSDSFESKLPEDDLKKPHKKEVPMIIAEESVTSSEVPNDDIVIDYKVYENELQMPDIMALIQKDLSEPYSIYTYRYFIHNWPKLCFLALHDGRCVGAIVCKLDIHRQIVKRGYIAMLAVDKNYRKLKIGTTLVQKAILAMCLDNADEVVLETEITNQPALRLYENLGFVRDKRLFHYYLNGVDALRLKLWFR